MQKYLGVLIAVAILALTMPVHAATKPTGLQVYPLRSRPSLQPGDTTTGELTVSNNSTDSMDVTLSVERFKVTDEDYHYDFAPGEYTEWVRLPDKQLKLEKGAKKKVAYSLAIPANAPPGGYYFSLFASTENSDSSTNFKEVKRVASLIYLDVGGQVNKKVNFLGFDTAWFLTKRVMPIDHRIANQGNTHVEARLLQTIRPVLWLGPHPEPVQKDGLILPGTIRKLSSNLKAPWLPGIYRLSVQFSPPQGGATQTSSQVIVYLPVWSWFVLALLFILASIFLVRLWRRRVNH